MFSDLHLFCLYKLNKQVYNCYLSSHLDDRQVGEKVLLSPVWMRVTSLLGSVLSEGRWQDSGGGSLVSSAPEAVVCPCWGTGDRSMGGGGSIEEATWLDGRCFGFFAEWLLQNRISARGGKGSGQWPQRRWQ